MRGPFRVLKLVTAGTPAPAGIAQRETVRKWYVQINHYCRTHRIEEGTPKILPIQERANAKPGEKAPSSPIKPAPQFEPDLKNVWFTEASSKREGKVWKYGAVALHVESGNQVVTEGEGSAQAGELIAAWSVIKKGSGKQGSAIHLYGPLCCV